MAGKILVCGDSMRDIYWFGECHRISPEAPVPVVKMGRIEERKGAAANVAENCKAMGAQVRELYGEGEPITKIRIIAKSQQIARIDYDLQQFPITSETFEGYLPDVSIVIFSDYGKGSLRYIQPLIQAALHRNCKILVDPKGHDYERYRGAHVVKPNTDEMREMVGGWGSEEELIKKARQLREAAGVWNILLTRASKGMTLIGEDYEYTVPAETKEVYDVSGAGDTAISALAVALDMGYELSRAVDFANRAAGVAVGRFGTTVVQKKEVFW